VSWLFFRYRTVIVKYLHFYKDIAVERRNFVGEKRFY
jgi:hypothetical protein